MRKNNLMFLAALSLSCSILFSSCVGSFALFNRISDWNQNVSSKVVNELVFIALNVIPVYGVDYLADALVINSIEFWSGSNPMASKGDVRKVKGNNGDYLVETLENGYSISKEGEETSMDLIFNNETQTWNVISEDQVNELLKLNSDGTTAELYMPNGSTKTVTLDAAGVLMAQQTVESGLFYAAR